jgi:hypothetical protein
MHAIRRKIETMEAMIRGLTKSGLKARRQPLSRQFMKIPPQTTRKYLRRWVSFPRY